MSKRVVLGLLLVVFVGILVARGINRTVARTGDVAGEHRQGQGEDASEKAGEAEESGQGHGTTTGQSSGRNSQDHAASGATERLYPNYETAPEDWTPYEGAVVEASTEGGELMVQSEDGQVIIGTGPGYMAA
jgi:hypothetical protein